MSAPASPPPRRATFADVLASGWWLGTVVVLGGALRVMHVLALRATPWFTHLVVDPQFYDAWAQRIAAGDWLGERAFYMDPLYPYVLGALYRVAGHDLLAARLLNVACSMGACVAVAYVGRRVAGPAAGGLAALGLALYEPDVFYVGEVDKTSLSLLLSAVALALAFRRSLPARFGAGVLTAAAALTRANLLAFVPLGAAALLLDPEGRGGRRAGGRRGLAAALVFTAGASIVLAPVAWRNHYVSGSWALTTTQAGQNFYTGNNPSNPYGAYGAVPFVRPNPYLEEEDFQIEAEKRVGHVLTSSEVSRFWFGAAVRHILEDPTFAARAVAYKLLLFWNDFEISDNQDQYLIERDSAVLRLPLLGFGSLVPLALLGAIAGFRARRESRLLTGVVLVYWLSLAAFFLFSRYRLPVVAAVLPLAASGAVELWRRVRRQERLLPAAAILAGAAYLSFVHVGLFWRDHPRTVEMRLRHLADMQLSVGQVPQAIASLQEAVAPCPPGCPWALGDLCQLYLRTGRAAEGTAWFRTFVATHPDQRDAPDCLERLSAAATAGVR